MATRSFGGWRLKVYHWEAETYPQFRKFKMDRHQSEVYLKKLSRHFKTSCPFLSVIRKHGDAGHYHPSSYNPYIALGTNPSLAVVCHEYAHHLDAVRNPDTSQWHGKSFRRELKKVYTFAKRYLQKEIATPPEVAIIN